MIKRRIILLLTALVIGGCTAYTAMQFEQLYGEPAPRDRVVETMPVGNVDYWSDVKPVIEQRCVVCHACYDAPCQLKMSSIEGIERGATSAAVYDQSRLNKIQPTRLFEDAQTVLEWRDLGFHPVLNEHIDSPEANREASVMYRILDLKEENPLPEGKILPDSFDLALGRKQSCAKPDTFDKYARKNPLWGMPYALPGLDAGNQMTLLKWLEQGAEHTPRAPLSKEMQDEVQVWEAFLNGNSLKSQLSGRYIYEHLFLTHLYFPGLDSRKFFKLVRSATPPGEPVQLIVTRRPYADPGVERAYYRIVEDLGTVVAKTHMPYALDAERMKRWQRWFVDADYAVTELPSYAVEVASNPFLTYGVIPVESRYRFLLDEAQNTIMSFIKGPVCRGQVALNVVNDRFWMFFSNPNDTRLNIIDEFVATQDANLNFPTSTESIYRPLAYWRKYSKQQLKRLAAIDSYLSEHFSEPGNVSLESVWDGDGVNDNAALTIFRHFDSATVKKGLIGQPPKTAWLVDYPLLERIHYLLVAGYDVFGNVGHQLLSRVYMDFLRMEGEANFLLLLPQEARTRERAFWYREADEEIMEFMTLPYFESKLIPAIDYQTDDEKNELFGLLKQRLEPVLSTRYDMTAIDSPAVSRTLAPLQDLVGNSVTLMPQVAFVEIAGQSGSHYVTLVRNNAHLNITSLFGEKKFRKPDEDTLTVIPGFLGAYPNVFFFVDEADLGRFVTLVSSLRTESDYSRLLDDFGVRRTNPNFWQQSDSFYSAYQQYAPIEYGLFDYNRLENR